MKTVMKVLLVAALVAWVVPAFSQEKAPGERTRGLMGKIVKVEGTNVVVGTRQEDGTTKETTVATDDKTEITVDRKAAKLADLKADMMVSVTPATGTATRISARSPGLYGKIVKVDGTNVVVATRERGGTAKEVTVATDDKTEITVDGKAAKLEDLKADMRVYVTPPTGTATKVSVSTGSRRGGRETPPAK